MTSKLCTINFPKLRRNKYLKRINELLAYQGRKLKRNNLLNACYTKDGIVTIKINECSKAIKIHHVNDISELFPNFDFED